MCDLKPAPGGITTIAGIKIISVTTALAAVDCPAPAAYRC